MGTASRTLLAVQRIPLLDALHVTAEIIHVLLTEWHLISASIPP
jgi:hypothetical protein